VSDQELDQIEKSSDAVVADATNETVFGPSSADSSDEANAAFWQAHGEFRSGISLTAVPAGVFQMGLDSEDEDYDISHVAHEVTLTNDFWMGTTEVTVNQWLAYMDYHPTALYLGEDRAAEELAMCGDCPVHSVSWDEIAVFSNLVSEAHGLESCFTCEGSGPDVSCSLSGDPYECEGYRLATEAEWERAAWGGESYLYPGSDDIDLIGYYEENSEMMPHAVASKMPNGYGLYDMGGNIREFVLDWQTGYGSEAQVNPFFGPDVGAYPAERGGSWACRIPELRPNRRNLKWDYDRDVHSGFRLARTVADVEVTGF
jgi:formylglycine-generating enzyme required for sulfatase activity